MAEYGKTKKLGKRIAKANQPKVAAKRAQQIQKAGSKSKPAASLPSEVKRKVQMMAKKNIKRGMR